MLLLTCGRIIWLKSETSGCMYLEKCNDLVGLQKLLNERQAPAAFTYHKMDVILFQHGSVSTSIIKCEKKFNLHSLTLTAESLKFWNG